MSYINIIKHTYFLQVFIILFKYIYEIHHQSGMHPSKIIKFPDPFLKHICKQVVFPLSQSTKTNIQTLKAVFRQSFKTHQVRTLGLSASQIGVDERFFIMPASINNRHIPLNLLHTAVRHFKVFINPKILSKSQKEVQIVENCLSLGTDVYKVVRSQQIEVQYFTEQNLKIVQKLSGIRARVFLHQYDHLDGITMDMRGQKLTDQQWLQFIGSDETSSPQQSKQTLSRKSINQKLKQL